MNPKPMQPQVFITPGRRPQIRGLRAGGSLAIASSTPATQLLSPARVVNLNHACYRTICLRDGNETPFAVSDESNGDVMDAQLGGNAAQLSGERQRSVPATLAKLG
jgi:hypothetical protein